MKKVAIITIESLNFGNRLQNYALQKVLTSAKCEVVTFHRNSKIKGAKEKIKCIVQNIFKTKAYRFREFDSYINFSEIVIGRDDFPSGLSDKYDYFIVGSDQVWNPYYNFVAGKCDFLCFAEDSQKVSYAASFGVDEIPDERKVEYIKYIKSFKEISVREKQGAKIVKQLTGRDATVVLDPTLLLTENEWKKVEKKSFYCPKGKYVFIYALCDKNEHFKKKIEQLRKKYEILDVRASQKNGRELSVGPSEFLYLIRNAEIILTDSFHATVFSIIFHKKFITFNRPGLNMNSRITSLAELLNLRKLVTESGDFDGETEIDYFNVDKILREERRKSYDFLEKALNNYE